MTDWDKLLPPSLRHYRTEARHHNQAVFNTEYLLVCTQIHPGGLPTIVSTWRDGYPTLRKQIEAAETHEVDAHREAWEAHQQATGSGR